MTSPQSGRPAPRRGYGPPPPAPMLPAPYAGYAQSHGPVPPAPVVVVAGPSRTVTRERKRTSHGLHLVLTVVTCGAWGLFVWLPLTLWHKMGPRRKIVARHR